MNIFRHIAALLWKDVLLELRTKEMLSSMLIFALMVVIIFNFVFDPGSPFLRQATPGILWVAFTFAGVLGLNRSFVHEVDKGCLKGLMLCPVDRSAIYLGKVTGNVIFIALVEMITLPIVVVFFNLSVTGQLPLLIAVVFLGTLGFAAVGTLFSAIAANTRTREIMLPVLLFPITVPLLIAAVKSTGLILAGRPGSDITGWVKLLVAFDLIFLVVSVLTFDYVIEE